VRDAARVSLSPKSEAVAAGAGGATVAGIVAAGWVTLGLLVVAFAAALTQASGQFGYAYDVAEMPVPALVAGLVAAGLVFCLALPPLIRAASVADARTMRLLMALIVVAGLSARLVLFASEPMLEDDYQRYLWDGAVTASGTNPYAVSPQAARALAGDTTLGSLAHASGPVVRRINHADLKTIYPPVAQGAFALAHLVQPWSLTAWRAIVLSCELVTLALVLMLLRMTGRSPAWSALYWWNPLLIKELANSAHMDAIVLPLVLGALLLAARGRQALAGANLALAVGAKIWPLLLLPLILRPLSNEPRRLAAALTVFGALVALLAIPIVTGGLDDGSGFTAYATRWQTSSALYPALEAACATLLGWLQLAEAPAGLLTRMAIVIALAGIAGAVCIRPITDANDLIGRASLVIAAIILLLPAPFPWYAAWFAPFLAFRPWTGFLVLTATAPLYYMSFYLTAAGEPQLFERAIVWIIWIPVWAALLAEGARHLFGSRPHQVDN